MKLNQAYLGLAFFFLLGSCKERTPEKALLPTSSESQADSTLNHFWDNYDFTNTIIISDPTISEQALLNFIHRFHKASPDGISKAIRTMLDQASTNEHVYEFFIDQYEYYLYNPNSPIRNDLYYKLVLDYLVTSPQTSEADKVHYKTRLALVNKNMPGSEITDFDYLSISNTAQQLHDIQASNKLLVFYDPGCPHCKEIIQELSKSTDVNTLLKQEKLKVVAICPVGNYKDWKNYQANIPSSWINGFEKGTLISQRLYDLKAFPTLFLIDRQNRVILKDTDLQHILKFFIA